MTGGRGVNVTRHLSAHSAAPAGSKAREGTHSWDAPETTPAPRPHLTQSSGTAGPAAVREAILIDIDGTLCDIRGIGRSGGDRWHRAAEGCPPVAHVVAAARSAHRAGQAVFIVTARSSRHVDLTRRWLATHLPVPYTSLLMWTSGRWSGHSAVKLSALRAVEREGYCVVHAYDDIPAVVESYRSAGVPATLVRGFGYY